MHNELSEQACDLLLHVAGRRDPDLARLATAWHPYRHKRARYAAEVEDWLARHDEAFRRFRELPARARAVLYHETGLGNPTPERVAAIPEATLRVAQNCGERTIGQIGEWLARHLPEAVPAARGPETP